jgi:hypothetical protein
MEKLKGHEKKLSRLIYITIPGFFLDGLRMTTETSGCPANMQSPEPFDRNVGVGHLAGEVPKVYVAPKYGNADRCYVTSCRNQFIFP